MSGKRTQLPASPPLMCPLPHPLLLAVGMMKNGARQHKGLKVGHVGPSLLEDVLATHQQGWHQQGCPWQLVAVELGGVSDGRGSHFLCVCQGSHHKASKGVHWPHLAGEGGHRKPHLPSSTHKTPAGCTMGSL